MVGGVGNFIKRSPAEDSVGCTTLTFDLRSFLSSEWYKTHTNQTVTDVDKAIDALKKSIYN